MDEYTVLGFLSCLQGELKHWAHRIKNIEMQDILNGVDIYWGILHSEDMSTDQWWTTKSADIFNGHGQNKRYRKDSTINENSHEYKFL